MTTTPDQIPSTELEKSPSLPSADNVKAALQTANATQDQISTVLWLLDYGRTNKLAMKGLGRALNRDGSTIYRVFSGRYEASLENFVDDVEHFRRVVTERQDFGDSPIVDTSVMRDVSSLCDLARVSCSMAFLFGPNQSGKTTAAKRYAHLNNHGRTIFTRMPVGGSSKMFMAATLKSCGISDRNSYDQMRDRAIRFFDPQVLWIIDEVHQAMIGRSLKTITIELIREIHDESGCGVVLIGTDVLPEMMNDPRFKKFLGQIDNRGVLRRRIPPAPCAADVRAICNSYGFPPADGGAKELVRSIARENGIGRLTKFLRMARKLAVNRKQPVGWEHFLTTHATLESWARGEESR